MILVKVIGFEPVAVFCTVIVALPEAPVGISLKVTLEGVILNVGAEVAAARETKSKPHIASATTDANEDKSVFLAATISRAMAREFMGVSTNVNLTSELISMREPGCGPPLPGGAENGSLLFL